MKFIPLKSGWKTYATVAIGIAVGVAQAEGYHIPSYIDWVLGFLGLGFHRLAVQKQSKETAEAVASITALVTDVLSEVTVPEVNSIPSPSGQTPLQEQEETKQLNKNGSSS